MAKRRPEPTREQPELTPTERYLAEQRELAAGDVVAATTAASKAKFLEAFVQLGNVAAACAEAGVGRRTHYDWLKDDGYKAVFADAVDEAADLLEGEARRRAMRGVQETVYHQGVECGMRTRYSDGLLVFLLKGARPEKYAERHKHTGTGKGGSILLETLVAGPELVAGGASV
jgi:hypothetical protein